MAEPANLSLCHHMVQSTTVMTCVYDTLANLHVGGANVVRFINLEHHSYCIGFGKNSCTLMLHLHGDHMDSDPHINKMKWGEQICARP